MKRDLGSFHLRDFKAFHPEQAKAFKAHLTGQVSARSGERLTQATLPRL